MGNREKTKKQGLLKTIFSIRNDREKTGYKIVTLLGLKFRYKKFKSKFEKFQEEIASLKEFIYQSSWFPQKVAALHQKVFPQFHNIHNEDNLVVVGCGSTLNYYEPLKNAKHIALNRSIRYKKIGYDYAFIWDLPDTKLEEPEFINEFLGYDCIKFVGCFLHDDYNVQTDINLPYKNKLYRCYSSSRAGLGLPVCDEVIHQDISLFPLADFCSISFGALNFAAYTHPKRIFLVGLDTVQAPCFDGKEHPYQMDNIIKGYKLFKIFMEKYYSDVEVISINPVGLKGLFRDVYTRSYLKVHPELLNENVEILGEPQEKELISA